MRKKWLGNTWVGKRGRSAGYGRWGGCAGHAEQALTFPSMHASACYFRRRQGSLRQLVAIAWPLALSLCCALVVRVGGDDAWQAEVQADEHGEGCTASAEPNDGTVFRDEAVPVLFVAVGFCPRAERAHAAGSGRAVAVELKLEPGGRQFRWNLEHGIDEFGVELQLPRNLPDEVYRGSIALSAPYNLVLPIHFAKLTTGARQLQVVFPVPGFVFGRASQAWLQVLVIDEGARARGVREVGYLLDVLVNGTHVHSVRSANGRRIYVPAARPGANAVRLIVKNVLGTAAALRACLRQHCRHVGLCLLTAQHTRARAHTHTSSRIPTNPPTHQHKTTSTTTTHSKRAMLRATNAHSDRNLSRLLGRRRPGAKRRRAHARLCRPRC